MTESDTRIHDDATALSAAACEAFCELARRTLDERGVFRVALAGGSTPKRLYEMLVERPLDWSRMRLFMGDERNVALDHPESNYRMVSESLLDPAGVPRGSRFPVPVAPDRPADTAAEYERTLRREFAVDTGLPRFDLVLLGMGDDAHTASLFPGTAALTAEDRLFVENWVPKFDAYRLTMTAPVINAGRNVWFLIAGANKSAAVDHVWNAPRDPQRYPSQLIAPEAGKLTWWLDKDAQP